MDELKLNRFRKRSGELVLEEFSHCEVPAGCGGAVLRWNRKDTPATFDYSLLCESGKPDVAIDGRRPERHRVTVAPGPHVFAFTLTTRGRANVILSMRGTHRPTMLLLSTPGMLMSAWGERADWTGVEEDDAGFTPMVLGTAVSSMKKSWSYGSLVRAGAAPVAPATKGVGKQRLVVRFRFALTPNGLVFGEGT